MHHNRLPSEAGKAGVLSTVPATLSSLQQLGPGLRPLLPGGARTTTICRDPCGGRASRALHDTGAAKSLDGEVRCCAVDSLNSRFRASRRQLLGFVTSQVDANWPARSASGLLVTRQVVSNGTRSALPTMRIAAAGDA